MTVRLDATTTLAADAQSLDQLRAQAKQSPEQALKAAAQQFETILLNMMLKSMREATPRDGMFDSEQTTMFTGMLDQQLAQGIASRGVGLADIMVKQLSRGVAGQAQSGGLPTPFEMQSPSFKPEFMPSKIVPAKNPDFVQRMLPFAMRASLASGVPPQLMLGQAALESGWGKREIMMADGSNSYNLFGIKASADWQGKVAEVMTTEYSHGVANKQVEKFRAYSSYAEAFQDYASLIRTNPRYANVWQQGGNVDGMAQALQQAGYATDPRYAEKLVRVMNMVEVAG